MSTIASRSLLAVAAVLAVGAVAACSNTTEKASASEKKPEPTTLTFTFDEAGAEFDQVDVGGKGESIGDRHVGAMTLLADGEPAGRFHTDCLVVDNAYEGQMCTMVAMLSGGTLTMQTAGLHKEFDGVEGSGEWAAVTGGTGTYAGARGEASLGADEDSPFTITLLP
jgi:hypothetical protein